MPANISTLPINSLFFKVFNSEVTTVKIRGNFLTIQKIVFFLKKQFLRVCKNVAKKPNPPQQEGTGLVECGFSSGRSATHHGPVCRMGFSRVPGWAGAGPRGGSSRGLCVAVPAPPGSPGRASAGGRARTDRGAAHDGTLPASTNARLVTRKPHANFVHAPSPRRARARPGTPERCAQESTTPAGKPVPSGRGPSGRAWGPGRRTASPTPSCPPL